MPYDLLWSEEEINRGNGNIIRAIEAHNGISGLIAEESFYIKDNIRISGSGSKKLSIEDKLCFALMNRYFILIEHENAINLEIHKDDIENESGITENKNTTGKHTLTDLIFDGTKFTNFNDFKKHTEKIIKDIMLSKIPDNTFTIETTYDPIINTFPLLLKYFYKTQINMISLLRKV